MTDAPLSKRIWEWWLDDWTGKDREIVLGFCDEVAELEQERDGLLEQVFALHDISHTYYGGCKCGTCAKYRALTAEQGEL